MTNESAAYAPRTELASPASGRYQAEDCRNMSKTNIVWIVILDD
jgi:hypothetical protein